MVAVPIWNRYLVQEEIFAEIERLKSKLLGPIRFPTDKQNAR